MTGTEPADTATTWAQLGAKLREIQILLNELPAIEPEIRNVFYDRTVHEVGVMAKASRRKDAATRAARTRREQAGRAKQYAGMTGEWVLVTAVGGRYAAMTYASGELVSYPYGETLPGPGVLHACSEDEARAMLAGDPDEVAMPLDIAVAVLRAQAREPGCGSAEDGAR